MKQRKRSIALPIAGVAILLLLAIGVAYSAGTASSQPESPSNQQANPVVSTYKFDYLASECQTGIDNYKNISPQYKTQLDRIQANMNEANANYDTTAFFAHKSQLEGVQKSMAIMEERVAKLSSCIDSVNQRLDFTPTELAEIKSFISTSNSLPVAQ